MAIQRLSIRFFTYFFLLLTLLRMIGFFYRDIGFGDFHLFYDSAKNASNGLDPYDPQILLQFATREYPEGVQTIISPTLLVLFYPLTLLNVQLATIVFLLLNLLTVVIVFTTAWCRAEFVGEVDLRSPKESTLRFSICLLILVNALPTTLGLGMGQIALLATLGILLSFLCSSTWIRGLAMGIATGLKYSLTPLFGLVMLLHRHFKEVIIAGGVLAVLMLVPLFFGQNLIELYPKYLNSLQHSFTEGGADRFSAGGGYNMVNLDLFLSPGLNMAFKVVLFLIFFMVLYKKRHVELFGLRPDKKAWVLCEGGLSLFLFTGCMTMLAVYHRTYDLVIIVILLLLYGNIFWLRRDWGWGCVCALFLLYFSIPQAILLPSLNAIGKLVEGNSIIYLGSFKAYQTVFPLPSIMMILLTVYSIFLCFTNPKVDDQ